MSGSLRFDLRTAVAATFAVVALALPVAGAFRQPGAPMEEGKLLIAAELVLEGKVPHEDFEHFYGPADVWAVAAAFAVGGRSVDVERAVGVVYFALLVGSVFALGRRLGRVPAALAAAAAGWIMVPFGVHAYSWTAGLALLLLAVALALSAIDRPANLHLAAGAGAAAGLALLFRADLVLAVGLVLAVVWTRLTPAQRLRGLVGGVATAAVPYLVHLAMAGFDDMWRGMITDSLFRLRDGRALPMPPPARDLTAWLDLSAPEPTPSPILPDHARVLQLRLFFWMTVFAIVATVAFAVWAWVRRRASRDATWLACIAAIGVGTASQMLQRADATHVRFVACVVLPLAPLAFAAVVHLLDAKFPRSATATEALVLSMVALLLAVPFYAGRLAGTTVGRAVGRVQTATVGIDGRSFPVIDPLAPDATALLGRMETVDRGGGKLFVGPQDLRLANYSDSFLYFLLGERFRPVSFFLESNPGIANADDSHLADDIARADVLILSKEYDNWDEPNTSRRPGPEAPVRVVAERFCVLAELGRYQILLPAGRC
ncbi:MAG TPA: hypothetical protein VM345_13670 [Acidimicrobiales bacterium]|nr:hypothetical protein [Acidimicrobiales bacterium]